MGKEMLHRLEIHLAKVILLRDAFSQEAVTNGIQIRTACGEKPVAKPGGYYLFLNQTQAEFEVEITSPIYQTRRVLLRADGGAEAEEILMYPSSAYPVRRNTTTVLGRAEPGSVLRFHLEEEASACKLIRDCRQGDEAISLFVKEQTGSGVQLWYIRNKAKKTGEYVQMRTPPDEQENYKLLHPIREDYRKKDTAIFPAWECEADEDGSFYLMLDRLKEREYTLYGSCISGSGTWSLETEIRGTKQNVIEGINRKTKKK